MTLKQFVEESNSTAGRAFDLAVQALVLLSLVSFSIETLPHLSPGARSAKRRRRPSMRTTGMGSAMATGGSEPLFFLAANAAIPQSP